MRLRRVWEVGLWLLGIGGGIVGARQWRGELQARGIATVPVVQPIPTLGQVADTAITLAATYLASHDGFRIDRRGPAGTTLTQRAPDAPLPPPAPPKPTLVLRGIVGTAPRWQAVLDGIPEQQGSVLLAAGDTIRGFKVTRIGGDTVVVRGADSTWKLTVRRQWQ